VTTDTLAKTTGEEMKEAFAFGKKIKVTPRDLEPVELHIRPFYTGQALDVIEVIERVFRLAMAQSNDAGDVDLFKLFTAAKNDVMTLLAVAIEHDVAFIRKLEVDELLTVFAEVWGQNKDFFLQRVKNKVAEITGQISTIL
jgi:hypothetical protein